MEKDIYKKLLTLGLQSSTVRSRILTLSSLWQKLENEKILFNAAKTDEVASHLGWLLKQSNLQYGNFWIEELEKVEVRMQVLMETLELFASSLAQSNIHIVALKNAGIAKGIYPVLACSPMGDIDLLVSSKDFHKAHDIIVKELGFTFKFRSELEEENLEEAFKGGGTEYYKEINGYTVWLELQWRPIAGRWIQPHNEPKGDDLMNRSVAIEGSSVRILSPEDNLLQVCLHTAKHSYVRAPGFRLHSDVDRIVRYQEINWDKFISNTLNLQLKTAVYFSLFFAKDLLNTPIPQRVFESLKPSWYRDKIIHYYVNKAGIFNQKKKKFSRLGYIIFNLSLYDSMGENMKAIFPPLDTMRLRYPKCSSINIPYYWGIRLMNLVFKRATL
ncbi:nucleotidyltransferase domain-containing protein [Lunatimonas salinarum]|uniref:nucleotidyltransferase domain-containing protein n=1 Tax=Lunatimonas salinarum TaxID=1774590 RepID=UPI001ADF3A39|nr:nucleotidyltransferase family protein [Lunatimonas salinarum]